MKWNRLIDLASSRGGSVWKSKCDVAESANKRKKTATKTREGQSLLLMLLQLLLLLLLLLLLKIEHRAGNRRRRKWNRATHSNEFYLFSKWVFFYCLLSFIGFFTRQKNGKKRNSLTVEERERERERKAALLSNDDGQPVHLISISLPVEASSHLPDPTRSPLQQQKKQLNNNKINPNPTLEGGEQRNQTKKTKTKETRLHESKERRNWNDVARITDEASPFWGHSISLPVEASSHLPDPTRSPLQQQKKTVEQQQNQSKSDPWGWWAKKPNEENKNKRKTSPRVQGKKELE